MATILSRATDLSPCNSIGTTPLDRAVLHGHHTTMRRLIAAGATVANNRRPILDGTQLSHAAYQGDMEMMMILLDGGAKFDASGSCNDQAIHWAASSGRMEPLQLLIDKSANANVSALSRAGTPLHRAVYFDHRSAMQLLLLHGADPSKVNTSDGQTPIWLAACEGRPEAAKLLIDAGARDDIIVADARGITPLHLAAAGGVARYCEAHNAVVHNAPFYSDKTVLPGYAAVLKVFFEAGVDVDHTDASGVTALHLAVAFRDEQAVQLLIDAGADVTRRTRRGGRTPLSIACERGHHGICDLLNDFRSLHCGSMVSYTPVRESPSEVVVTVYKLHNIVSCYPPSTAIKGLL